MIFVDRPFGAQVAADPHETGVVVRERVVGEIVARPQARRARPAIAQARLSSELGREHGECQTDGPGAPGSVAREAQRRRADACGGREYPLTGRELGVGESEAGDADRGYCSEDAPEHGGA